jgi:hypothetical protein
MRVGLARLVAGWVLVAGAACSDEEPISAPGTRTATLVSPNGAEGAAILVLVGDGVGAIESLGETEVYRHDADGMTRLVLIDLYGGDLAFRVAVVDTTALPAVVIHEVAGPVDELRSGLDAYRLEIGP